MSQLQSTLSKFLYAIAIVCLLVGNIDSHCLYDILPADPVKWVRGHEFVLDIPKYNMKITSTIKDDHYNHGPSCGCDECSSADTRPSYELVPIVYTTSNAEHPEPTHIEPHSVYRQAEASQEPVLGSPRHKHKQDWFYSAPSWMPSGSENMNILRTAEPRGIIKSNSHFVKVNKNHFGNSFVHSHSSSFVKTKPHHGGLSVHKNLHVHKFRNSEDFGQVGAPRQVDHRFVGSHMFAAPRWRRDTRRRTKRGVLEFVRLVGDHNTKLDMSKTAENVGAATKNVFENDKSPVYHMRNLVGSSQDALMSMLSARPRGVLIPSKYRIVSADETPIVGAINPGLYQQNGPSPSDQEQQDEDGEEQPQYEEYSGRWPVEFDDTFSRIGSILRESVQRAHKSAEHAVDAVHSARQVVATARKYWPKILLPYAGAVEVEKKQRGEEMVGSAQDPNFVGIGRIMDYFSVTGDQEPRLGAARYISEEEQLLNNAKNSLGTATYRQFMEKMKKELGRYQRLKPKTADGEQVGSRLLPRLPLRPVHRPLLLNPNLHRIRTALRLPARPIKRPSPALLKLRESLKVKPVQRLPKIRNPLLRTAKPESPALAKLRDALKPEAKADKPMSPALAKLREAIAQRKAARKSPLVGKAQSVTEENETEPESTTINVDYAYSEEDTDKSAQLNQPQAQSVITSPHLDDSEEVTPESNISRPAGAQDRLRTKLEETSKERTSNVDKGDLLGRALEILRSRTQQKSRTSADEDEVGAAQLTTPSDDDELGAAHNSGDVKFAAVPVPIFTKEMKTPFMGFASQTDLDQYFKNLYCAECKKKNREADET
ncbi:hypothetical protein CBL_09047 [Carabus blaptoides fortunei]